MDMYMWKYFGITHTDHTLMNPMSLAKTEELIERLCLPDGGRVLDLACGPATQLAQVAELNADMEFTGLDLSTEMLASAEQHIRDCGLTNIQLTEGDITKLPQFLDASFDAVICTMALHHLPTLEHLDSCFSEIARVLKPGGRLSITFDFRGPGVSLAGMGPNYDPDNLIQSPADVERHFLSSGDFELVGNKTFEDNGKSYLVWPGDPAKRYTFGALFLRKSG